MRAIEILATGPLATTQDDGRPGMGSQGVSVSGAADRRSFQLANRLVGNEEHAAVIEITLGGFQTRAHHDMLIAITGAPCPVTIDGKPIPVNAAHRLSAGSVLRTGLCQRGLRSYLSVRGGIAVPPVLASRARDTLANIGPPPLRPGTIVPIGTPPTHVPPIDFAPVHTMQTDDITLTVTPGPRHDWFTKHALHTLLSEAYTVTSESNRIGMRLAGPELLRTRADELPSEGTVPGSLQVPPIGRPTLFLTDHPVTGGYPVIAVVLSSELDKAAQARPGQRLRFRSVQPTQSQ